jgi:hypothetical protein
MPSTRASWSRCFCNPGTPPRTPVDVPTVTLEAVRRRCKRGQEEQGRRKASVPQCA